MKNTLYALVTMFAVASSASAQSNVTTITGWDSQLFPSYLIATATVKPTNEDPAVLGDPNGQLGACIEANKSGAEVKVTVTCDEFMEPSHFTGTLPQAGTTYQVFPKVRYRYDRLSKNRQATPATVNIRVEIDSKVVEDSSTAVVFRSINDCPLHVKQGDNTVDTMFTFAAFVNEQHPFVDKLLREALDRGIVQRFDGYQSKDPASALRQVYALWDLMVARDVRYSDIATTAAESSEVLSQHVRMIEETANNSQANCVDGSVLLVSLLRKIGIDAALVLEPGHCFVIFSLDSDRKLMYGLETTLIDTVLEQPKATPELFAKAVHEDLRGEYSWPSFVAAIGLATSKLNEPAAAGEKEAESKFQIIDIATARQRGVLPIAFDSKEVFVAYDHLGNYTNETYTEESESEGDEEGTWSEEEWSEESDESDETAMSEEDESDYDEDEDEDDSDEP